MGRQGCFLSDIEIQTIVRLLASTDMQIAEIAHRMGCSKSLITAINRRHAIRFYEGRRNEWRLTPKKAAA
jgi:hypothetical protein